MVKSVLIRDNAFIWADLKRIEGYQMNGIESNKRLKKLGEECENIKHERKLLATEYEKLTEIVKKCGIACIVCLVLHNIVLAQFMKSKNVSVIGLGRFLSPFVFVIFLASFIVFMIKGFDWFLHADTKYSRMLAVKLDKATVSEELKHMNNTIMAIEAEIDKIESEMYKIEEVAETKEIMEPVKTEELVKTVEPVETVEPAEKAEPVKTEEPMKTVEPVETKELADDFAEFIKIIEPAEIIESKESAEQIEIMAETPAIIDDFTETVQVKEITEDKYSGFTETSSDKRTSDVEETLQEKETEEAGRLNDNPMDDLELMDLLIQRTQTIMPVSKEAGEAVNVRKTENVEDILSGLDALDVDIEEDEDENSSELWKKDAMKRYSRL